jgi:hypothetical protein
MSERHVRASTITHSFSKLRDIYDDEDFARLPLSARHLLEVEVEAGIPDYSLSPKMEKALSVLRDLNRGESREMNDALTQHFRDLYSTLTVQKSRFLARMKWWWLLFISLSVYDAGSAKRIFIATQFILRMLRPAHVPKQYGSFDNAEISSLMPRLNAALQKLSDDRRQIDQMRRETSALREEAEKIISRILTNIEA